ncbi:MAG: protein kinase [Acidobacteriota bacterium]|nr:protein kinase [Acidobacteriota bacterium]
MALAPGTRIGAYEVLGSLGAGGMGEVYRAKDSKLKREVALKVLPADVANDRERMARFQREAEVLASLNHPHIAQIYGIEEGPAEAGHHIGTGEPGLHIGADVASGFSRTTGSDADVASGFSRTTALVMELVEGEDLAERLKRGAIPIDEALPIAKQIAEALEAAHEQGIIHRDLKPANIKVRPDGTVKVLDFGLAKALEPGVGNRESGVGNTLANSPTITSPAMTMRGMILGTAAYMAPEQAKGKAVDKRADIWAFGVVLFEMLTGTRAFKGDDVTDIITSVMRDTPDWGALPLATAPAIRTLLRRALEKDPRRRLPHIAVARLEIDDAIVSTGELVNAPAAPAPGAPTGRTPLVWAVAGAAAAMVVTLALPAYRTWRNPPAPEASTTLIAQLGAPASVVSAFHEGFALSPDAATLAFIARGTNGVQQLWVRPLDALEARPLDGTEGARYPFWSPDSTELGFFVRQQLRRISLSGGSAQTICDVPGPMPTGSWGDNGVILVGAMEGMRTNIYTVPATGGAREIALAGAYRPQWLPGARGFLYADEGSKPGVYVQAEGLDSPRQLVALGGNADEAWAFTFSRAGYLYVNRNGALTMQRFDLDSLNVGGPVVPLAGAAGTPSLWMAASAAAHSLAALVPQSADDFGNPGDPVARLKWVNRMGETAGEIGEPARYWSLRLAPDGRRVAANLGGGTLWLLDGNRRSAIAAGTEGGGENGIWSPNGRAIVYSQVARTNLVRRSLGTGGTVEELPGLHGYATDWSGDGAFLLVMVDGSAQSQGADIVLYDFAAKTSRPFLSSPANELQARFSPDGRWVAYVSNAGGREDVLIRSFAGDGAAHAVSTGGGAHPIWRRDGRELFYLSPNDDLMAVPVSLSDADVSLGEPKALFRILLNSIGARTFTPYDVSADGQRFLLNVTEGPQPLLFISGVGGLLPQ